LCGLLPLRAESGVDGCGRWDTDFLQADGYFLSLFGHGWAKGKLRDKVNSRLNQHSLGICRTSPPNKRTKNGWVSSVSSGFRCLI